MTDQPTAADAQAQFIAGTRTDAHMAMVVRMCADAWASGYEAAIRDEQCRDGQPPRHVELRDRAYREMTDSASERDSLTALALLGKGLDEAKLAAVERRTSELRMTGRAPEHVAFAGFHPETKSR